MEGILGLIKMSCEMNECYTTIAVTDDNFEMMNAVIVMFM